MDLVDVRKHIVRQLERRGGDVDLELVQARQASGGCRPRQQVSTSSFLSLARIAGALAGFATRWCWRARYRRAPSACSSVTSLAAVVGLIAAHSYPAIAPRFLSRCREQGKQALIAAFIVRADRDALVYIAIATLGVLAWRSGHRQSRRAAV